VSAFRLVLAPALMLLILAQSRGASYVAAAVFVAGAATDGLDGYLARRFATVTRTGQWLDPLSDKLLVTLPAITMTALGTFPLWAAVVIGVREVGILVLRVVLGTRGRAMPASQIAKWKTVAQLLAIELYILPLGHGSNGLRLAVLIVAVALTVITGVDYLAREFRTARKAQP
jgi:CDP-diacylglycerol--glycerol-3-phosphate 3-phosphatidyltransferase